jgi:hypothetical protein
VLEPDATPTLRAAIERLPAGAVADDLSAAEDLPAAA